MVLLSLILLPVVKAKLPYLKHKPYTHVCFLRVQDTAWDPGSVTNMLQEQKAQLNGVHKELSERTILVWTTEKSGERHDRK